MRTFLIAFVYAKELRKMQYTLLGFGLTLTILLTIESINKERA